MTWSYEKAGVNLAAADSWVDAIKGLVGRVPRDPRVVGGIGGFSGLFRLQGDLLLAGCCDGVGTKVEVAREAGDYRGLGQDLVAMNVNDLVTCGARPLFFLDYLACGRLEVPVLSQVVAGVVDACAASDCVLLGGETAEMPGVYAPTGLDLAGFSVGMVREADLLTPDRVRPGDLLLGLSSSGVHSNGYSLVRSALLSGSERLALEETPEGLDAPLGETLLRPTKLYVRPALAAAATGKVRAMAHITGGGLEGNLVRVIPEGLKPELRYDAWERPEIFRLLSRRGVEEEEMRRVFNLGIGFVLVVPEDGEAAVCAVLKGFGEEPRRIGRVVPA